MGAGGAWDGDYRRGRKKANRARRTSRSLGGIGLFDLNFLQLFLQPSRIDDRHGLRSVWGVWGCGVRGAGCEYGVKMVGLGWSGARVVACAWARGRKGTARVSGTLWRASGCARGPPTRECAGLEKDLYGTFSHFCSLVQTHERCCRLDKHTILYIED